MEAAFDCPICGNEELESRSHEVRVENCEDHPEGHYAGWEICLNCAELVIETIEGMIK